MITNHLLEEKYRVQKQLAETAQYDLNQYVQNSHLAVLELAKQYGVTLKYGKVNCGRFESPRGD
jgi:hypothetical protein